MDKIPSQANRSNIDKLGFKFVFKNLRLASGLTAFLLLSWSIMSMSSCVTGQMSLLAGPIGKSQNVGAKNQAVSNNSWLAPFLITKLSGLSGGPLLRVNS